MINQRGILVFLLGVNIGVWIFFKTSSKIDKEKIEKLEKENYLKDSLYINCNGQIKQLNNNFLYKDYLKNHGN